MKRSKHHNVNSSFACSLLLTVLLLNLLCFQAEAQSKSVNHAVRTASQETRVGDIGPDLGGGLIELLLTGTIKQKLHARSPSNLSANEARNLAMKIHEPIIVNNFMNVSDYKGVKIVVINENRGELYLTMHNGKVKKLEAGAHALNLAKSILELNK